VARLIAEGRTYRQIADELSVVVKTVEEHVGGAIGPMVWG
jgi:DNA-binding NarL/FixJ family response regulator